MENAAKFTAWQWDMEIKLYSDTEDVPVTHDTAFLDNTHPHHSIPK